MRVVSGKLRGRNFNSPHGHRTHPMSEKIRGAIFNALGDIEGLRVLDAYAGTGALAIESMSRGAVSAVAIDLDGAASRIIRENIVALGLEKEITSTKASIRSWSRRHQKELFDIVFLDPPYDAVEIKELITIAAVHTKPRGILVTSLPPHTPLEFSTTTYKLLSHKSYGDAEVSIYRRNETEL